MAVAYGWLFSVICFMTLFVYVAATLGLTSWRRKFRRIQNKAETATADLAVDSMLNAETVKSFTAQEVEVRRYDELLQRFFSIEVATRVSLLVLNSIQSMSVTAGLCAALVLASYKVKAGELNVGDLVSVQLFIMQASVIPTPCSVWSVCVTIACEQLVAPLSWLGSAYEMIVSAVTDAESLLDVMKEELDVADEPGASVLQLRGGEIRFDDVTFAYGERQVLKGTDFVCAKIYTVLLTLF